MSFDTRQKIITLEQARAMVAEPGVPSIAFVTHLEVLRASHIRKLEEIAAANRHGQLQGRLFVILTDRETALVPLPERAEIAAALRVVDYVIPAPAGAGQLLDALHPTTIIHDEEEDRERTRLLIEHVSRRARS
jgi:hypothetical protein